MYVYICIYINIQFLFKQTIPFIGYMACLMSTKPKILHLENHHPCKFLYQITGKGKY